MAETTHTKQNKSSSAIYLAHYNVSGHCQRGIVPSQLPIQCIDCNSCLHLNGAALTINKHWRKNLGRLVDKHQHSILLYDRRRGPGVTPCETSNLVLGFGVLDHVYNVLNGFGMSGLEGRQDWFFDQFDHFVVFVVLCTVDEEARVCGGSLVGL